MRVFFETVFEFTVDLLPIFVMFFIGGIAGAASYAMYELGIPMSAFEVQMNASSAGGNFTMMQILFNALILSFVVTWIMRRAMTRNEGSQ